MSFEPVRAPDRRASRTEAFSLGGQIPRERTGSAVPRNAILEITSSGLDSLVTR